MDINDLRGIGTILCLVAFLGVVCWAYAPGRKAYFDAAAQLPFADGGDTDMKATGDKRGADHE